MPSSRNTSRTRTRGPRATSAPSEGHRGPASVCKQTGHVAPAASSPPPCAHGPHRDPTPDSESAVLGRERRVPRDGAGGAAGPVPSAGCPALTLSARPVPTRARPAPRSRFAYPAASCTVRAAPGLAPRGCAAAKDRPAGSRAPGALLKPQSPPLLPPPLCIPPGRGWGLPYDGRAPAPIPSAQHIATRRGLARHGRSHPPRANQERTELRPPLPLPPTPHPSGLAGLGCGECCD